MPKRMYHEVKAKRCLKQIVVMNRKIDELENIRVMKIQDLKEEIENIKNSVVSIRCTDCNRQFNISFYRFSKGSWSYFCPKCQRQDNLQYAQKVADVLEKGHIKYKCDINGKITIIMPHQDVI